MFTPQPNAGAPRINVQTNDRLELGQRHQFTVQVKVDVLFKSRAVRLHHLLSAKTQVKCLHGNCSLILINYYLMCIEFRATKIIQTHLIDDTTAEHVELALARPMEVERDLRVHSDTEVVVHE